MTSIRAIRLKRRRDLNPPLCSCTAQIRHTREKTCEARFFIASELSGFVRLRVVRGKPHWQSFTCFVLSVPSAYSGSGMRSITLLAPSCATEQDIAFLRKMRRYAEGAKEAQTLADEKWICAHFEQRDNGEGPQ